VDVGGHELRVEQSGSGTLALVCLHGLVDRLEIWDRIAPALSTQGRLIRFDQRGHGESDAPPGPYRREDLARDVVGVLDAFGIERAVLVGHSMGGIISMTTALAHPDRVAGLVLLGTASHCNEKTAAWYERIALAGERDGNAGLARIIYGKDSKREVTGNANGIAEVTRTLKSLHTDPLTPKLGQIGCPALLVVGEKDPMGPKASANIAAEFAQGRATLHVLPGLGHWTHVQAPDVVAQAIADWLPAVEHG
jgi:3-oxoadipate enol-lactonase